MKIVYTTGVFDILHKGHLSILQHARSLGDKLIIGVQDDDSVEMQKGRRPIMSCDERKAALLSLPFVDECVSYHDVDQRGMLREIKPAIMMQTEEWNKQTDRSFIVSYLKEHGIALELVPIDKNISSSEIKRRVVAQALSFRKDFDMLSSSLKILPLDLIVQYERFDPQRTEKLVDIIRDKGAFINPITVGTIGDMYILIDGANRYEALRRLGARYIFVQVVDYTDSKQVELTNNVHFIDQSPEEFISFLDSQSFLYRTVDFNEFRESWSSLSFVAGIEIDDTYLLIEKSVDDPLGVRVINSLVNGYAGKHRIYRLSELSQESNRFSPVKIVFRRFRPADIVSLVENSDWLESGVTWHKVKHAILRFRVPLDILFDTYDTVQEAQGWLQNQIDLKVQEQDIRYYPSNIYLCDEWT